MICPDYENDLTYYVNYGNDNYIYQLDDGVSTLLVEKEAHSLQLWNSELYFIEDTDSSPIHSGDIYCLNLDTKELRLVLKFNAFNFYINPYNIYIEYIYDDFHIESFLLDFNSSVPKDVDYNLLASYNEHQILYTYEEGFYIHSSETKEKIFIASEEYINNNPMLYNEYFMFIQESCIYKLNLLNGEKKFFDLYNYESLSHYDMVIMDYCVVDKSIYATTGVNFYIVNMDNGYIEQYIVDYSIDDFETQMLDFSIYNLYTDEKKSMGNK